MTGICNVVGLTDAPNDTSHLFAIFLYKYRNDLPHTVLLFNDIKIKMSRRHEKIYIYIYMEKTVGHVPRKIEMEMKCKIRVMRK